MGGLGGDGLRLRLGMKLALLLLLLLLLLCLDLKHLQMHLLQGDGGHVVEVIRRLLLRRNRRRLLRHGSRMQRWRR